MYAKPVIPHPTPQNQQKKVYLKEDKFILIKN